jgi:hypothetical protein
MIVQSYAATNRSATNTATGRNQNPRIFHIPTDLVVDRWASEMKSSSSLDFLFLCSVWTTFGRLMSDKITSAISTAWNFTTKRLSGN